MIRAVLLMGPTGSGKTPQGMLLERAGGFRHFDFGAELRAAADDERALADDDVAFVRHMLDTHALLPDKRFDLAAGLLHGFLERTGFDPVRERLVLNGLPRHAGQAGAVAEMGVRVERVVVFECDAEGVRARVARRRRGEGLDPPGRADDSDEAIGRKLAIFAQQTAPLIAHYEADPAARVTHLHVTADTSDAELNRRLREVLAE